MNDLGIFGCEHYKEIIRLSVENNQSLFDRKLTYQRIAEDCQIQKTYLSKVMNHDADLSSDQFFSICQYLKLTEEEIEFSLCVHSFDRSQNRAHKTFLAQKIKEKKREALKFVNQSESQAVSLSVLDSLKAHYYLDPIHQLIHMLLTIQEYQNDTKKIAAKLQLTSDQVQEYLLRLRQMELIQFRGKRITVIENNIHLDQDSEIFKYHVRLIDQLKLGKTSSSPDDYVTSVVFASSKETRDEIKKRLLKVLKFAQKSTLQTKATDLLLLRIDLLEW